MGYYVDPSGYDDRVTASAEPPAATRVIMVLRTPVSEKAVGAMPIIGIPKYLGIPRQLGRCPFQSNFALSTYAP